MRDLSRYAMSHMPPASKRFPTLISVCIHHREAGFSMARDSSACGRRLPPLHLRDPQGDLRKDGGCNCESGFLQFRLPCAERRSRFHVLSASEPKQP